MSVSVSGGRVSVDKSLFDRDGIDPEVFDSLPQTLYGTCDHWAGQGGKVGGKINIEWDANDAEQDRGQVRPSESKSLQVRQSQPQ